MRLHVHHLGDPDGAPLVCLHGLSGHGRRYVRLAERLPHRHLIAPDLRGHGASGAEPPWDIATHVADIVETIEVAQADWLGFSFGGRIAAHVAHEHPQRVLRLVLLDAALHIPPAIAHAKADEARRGETYPSFDAAVEGHCDPDDPYGTPRIFFEEEVRENFVEGEDGTLTARWDPAMAVTAFSEMARPAPPPSDHPTLSVVADASWIPPVSRGEVIAVHSGHPVLWNAFDATAEAVARHIDSPR